MKRACRREPSASSEPPTLTPHCSLTRSQDAIKTIYFFATDGNSVAFKACAIFQLSVSFFHLAAR
jgi:hypothetical protein